MINTSTLRIAVCTFLLTVGLFYVVAKSLPLPVLSASPEAGSSRAGVAGDQLTIPADPAGVVIPSASSAPDGTAEPVRAPEPVPAAVAPVPRKMRSGVQTLSGYATAAHASSTVFPVPEKQDYPRSRRSESPEPESAVTESSPTAVRGSVEENSDQPVRVSVEEDLDQPVRLKAGTRINVTVDERLTVSGAQGAQGGRFKGILNKAIRVGRRTIADKGSVVEGRFAPAEGGNGRVVLALNLVAIRTVDGKTLPLVTASVDRGHHKSKSGLWKGLAVAGITATSMLAPQTAFRAPVMATVAGGLLTPDYAQMPPNYPPVMPVVLEGTRVEFKLKRDISFGSQ